MHTPFFQQKQQERKEETGYKRMREKCNYTGKRRKRGTKLDGDNKAGWGWVSQGGKIHEILQNVYDWIKKKRKKKREKLYVGKQSISATAYFFRLI